MTASKKAIEGWAKSPTDAIIRDLIYGLREQPWISREDIAVILERDLLPRAEATAAAEQRLREVERQRDGARQTADELVDRVLDIAVRLGSASDVAAAQLARREWRAKPWASDRALLDTPPASPRQGEPVEPGPATKIAAEIDRARQMIEDGRGGPMSGEYRAGFLAALAALRDEFASWDPRLAALSEPAEAGEPG